jgi:hypothetical protein
MVLKGASKLQAVIDQMTNLIYLDARSLTLTPKEFVLQDTINESRGSGERWPSPSSKNCNSNCRHHPSW